MLKNKGNNRSTPKGSSSERGSKKTSDKPYASTRKSSDKPFEKKKYNSGDSSDKKTGNSYFKSKSRSADENPYGKDEFSDKKSRAFTSRETSKPRFNNDDKERTPRSKSFVAKDFVESKTGKKNYGDKPSSDRKFSKTSGNSFDEKKEKPFSREKSDDKKYSSSRGEKSEFKGKPNFFDKHKSSKSSGESPADKGKPFERPTKFSTYDKREKPFSKDKSSDKPYSPYRKDGIEKPLKPKFEKEETSSRFSAVKKTNARTTNFRDDSDYSFDDDFSASAEKPKAKREPVPKSLKNILKKSSDSENGEVRLNKLIANAGICSRREADEFISAGVVKVNGKVVSELGYKVKLTDVVTYNGETIKREKPVYFLMNKPKDFITTTDDPQERKTVMNLISGIKERIYPVGRLDRNTTGILLLTNDGDLTKKLTHPSFEVKKIYHAFLDKPFQKEDMEKLREGLHLHDGFLKPDDVSYVVGAKSKNEVGIELHSGKNRIVRRLFEHLGYTVERLDRVFFAGITKKDLSRGEWRALTEREIAYLKSL